MPVIDEAPYSYREVNVATQERDADSYLAWTRYLIRARQEQPALCAGALEWVETGDQSVLAFRRTEGENRVLCVFNLTDQTRPAGIDLVGGARNLLSREGDTYPARAAVRLEPFQALWLVESSN
jgi:maltose alpha-D-glucosyltransferase/alpha-amylase